MTRVHLGFADDYILSCVKAFLHGLVVALPVGITIGPMVRRMTNKIVG